MRISVFAITLACMLGMAQPDMVYAESVDGARSAIQVGKYADALKALLPLANAGDAEAQRIIGEMCFKGQGMKPNPVAAFKWTELAAANGNKIAQYNLGYLYEKGAGVGASTSLAIEWYTKAAIQGYTAAQHKLGDLYTSSNPAKAIYWYKAAGESGDDVALRNFSSLSSELVSARLRASIESEAAEKAAKQEQEQEEDLARRQAQREQQAREDEDAQAVADSYTALNQQIRQRGAEDMALLRNINRQTNAAYAETNRRLAAQAAERESARNEQAEREAERHREADRQRLASADAERTRAATASRSFQTYQQPAVTRPSTTSSCPSGTTYYNPADGIGAPGGTCYANPHTGTGATATLGGNGARSGRSGASGGGSDTANNQQTSGLGGGSSAGAQEKKTKWGPVKLEALAICGQSPKSGNWKCYGPTQNQPFYDSPSLDSDLASQHCDGGTEAAGGPVIDGIQWNVYRCGHSLGAGDYDITKRYPVITARRSYICPEDQLGDGRCTTPYDGQDRR